MCRLKKTAAFEYVVSKLIGLDLTKEAVITPQRMKELNNKLSEYPMTRYMKLLYFLCLTEAMQEREETSRDWRVQEPKNRLLGVFDNFVALRNGHVEIDIYENRLNEGMFSLFTFEDGRLKLREGSLTRETEDVLRETDSDIRRAVDEALNTLGGMSSKIVQDKSILEQDTTALVELSHSLDPDVWPACYYYDRQEGRISELFRADETLLEAELEAFKKQLRELKKGEAN